MSLKIKDQDHVELFFDLVGIIHYKFVSPNSQLSIMP
jgi:hypothetical protein